MARGQRWRYAWALTTHGADMHQRLVTLKMTGKVRGKGLNMRTPKAPGVAPPGYYMLFVLNGNGKPSLAKWVKLDRAAPASSALRQSPRVDGARS